ncbi:MAG: hypothetical protein ACXVBY_22710, partial [Isosphaeraceae bacterium]
PLYLRRAQAADYVRCRWGFPCSQGYLNKLASVGGGPVFRRAGRWPIYIAADLDAWAQSKITGPLKKTSGLAPISWTGEVLGSKYLM